MENQPSVNRYRFFRRASGVYYIQDNRTGKQESLRTRDADEAERLANHRNESDRIPAGHRNIAIGYLQAADPDIRTRTWSYVMDYFCAQPNKPAISWMAVAAAARTGSLGNWIWAAIKDMSC